MKKELKINEAANFLGVNPDTLRRWDKVGKIKPLNSGLGNHRKYDFLQLEYFLLNNIDYFAKKWINDDSSNLPNDLFYCPDSYIFQGRINKLKKELEKAGIDNNLSFLILAITGEIGNNSFDHNIGNWSKVVGIFFSYNIEKREIFLIDKGQGIFSSLKKVIPNLSDDFIALEKAFTQAISSRYPESRGNGLKFVKDVVINNKINLYFQSGKAYLILDNKNKEVKIKKAKKYFKGCLAKINF
jgi:hypothetical protein